MAKRAILLAGLHKTASTAIQLACGQHARQLREAGIHYPLKRVGDKVDANHTFMLRELFRVQPGKLGLHAQFDTGIAMPAGRQARMRKEFAASLPPCDLLLVAEGVSVFTPQELGVLNEWLTGQGYTVNVVCHVRRLQQWLNSMIAQRVVGNIGITIAQAVGEIRESGSIVKARIEAMRTAFGGVEVRSFEDVAAHEGGPAAHFLESLGIRLREESRGVRVNEGRSELATRAMSLTNEKFGRAAWKGSPLQLGEFLKHPSLDAMRALPGPKFALRWREAEPLAPLIASENQWLAKEFGAAFGFEKATYNMAPWVWTREDVESVKRAAARLPPLARDWLAGQLDELSGIGGAGGIRTHGTA